MTMDAKFIILLLLAGSFLALGCAKKGAQGNVTGGGAASAGEMSAAAGSNASQASGNNTPAGASAGGDKNQDLADLFNISTDKPIGDEGLGAGNPSPGSNGSN